MWMFLGLPPRRGLGLTSLGFLLAACLTLAGAARAQGTTVALTPVADASLFSPTLSEGERGDGRGEYLWVSTTAEGQARRMLLRFDLGSVPAGREVLAARLVLYESRSRATHPVSVHRLLQAWSEGPSASAAGNGSAAVAGDATWQFARFPDLAWLTPGGHFSAQPSATIVVGLEGETYTWGSTPALVADVRAWLADPSSNHGWLLKGDETTSRSAKRFESRESIPSVWPRLEIDLAPEATPPDGDVPLPWVSVAVLGLFMASVLARARG